MDHSSPSRRRCSSRRSGISILNDGFFEPFTILAVGMIVGYAGVGALVASREPANPIGWIMMAMGLGFLATGLATRP